MNYERNKGLGGLFSGLPSYKLLNNSPRGNFVGQVEQDENKFWSVKSLYVLAGLQMIFGVILCSTQLLVNTFSCQQQCKDFYNPMDQIEHYSNSITDALYETSVCTCYSFYTYAVWCGGIIFLSGLLSTLTTKFKTNFLLVVSSFFCVVGYVASLCSLVMSSVIGFTQIENNYGPYYGVFFCMAVISALNFFVSVLTSAFFCRASCSCCQPHGPSVMYLSSVDVSSTTVQQTDNFVTA